MVRDKISGIFIGIPTIHNLNPNLCKRLWEARDSVPCPVVLELTLGGSPNTVSSARNILCKQFLETKLEWMVQIDSDVVPRRSFLTTLVLEAHRTRKPFTCCPYPIAIAGGYHLGIGTSAPTEQFPLRTFWHSQIPQGWSHWDVCGTGCWAIHRHVLEQLSLPYFKQWQYDKEGIILEATEDAMFCLEVFKRTGYKVWTHSSLIADHWHNMNLAPQADSVEVIRK